MRAVASSGSRSSAGAVGEHEQFGEVGRPSARSPAADHAEVRLVAVQVGHEDDAGLVAEVGAGRCGARAARSGPGSRRSGRCRRRRARRARRPPRGRSRRRCRAARRCGRARRRGSASGSRSRRRCTCGRRRAAGGAARSRASASSSESLMPSTLAALSAMIASNVSVAASRSACAPVAGERGVEHRARASGGSPARSSCGEDARRRPRVVVRAARGAASARLAIRITGAPVALDERALLLVGGADRPSRSRLAARREVVGAGARSRCAPPTARASAARGGSAPAWPASRAPCRAGRCPSPRRRAKP